MHQKPSLENLVTITGNTTIKEIDQRITELEAGYTPADRGQDKISRVSRGVFPLSDRTQQISKLLDNRASILEFVHQSAATNSN